MGAKRIDHIEVSQDVKSDLRVARVLARGFAHGVGEWRASSPATRALEPVNLHVNVTGLCRVSFQLEIKTVFNGILTGLGLRGMHWVNIMRQRQAKDSQIVAYAEPS